MNEEPTPPTQEPTPRKSPIGIVLAVILAILLTAGVVMAIVMNQETIAPADKEAPPANGTENTSEREEQPQTDQQGSSEAEAATITFTRDGFSPSTLNVKKGTVVTVVNSSESSMQFSSDDHPTHRKNTEMNLRVLAPGESASFTADTPGTHDFHDHLDDNQTGTLTVTE